MRTTFFAVYTELQKSFTNSGLWNKRWEWNKQRFCSHKWSKHKRWFARACESPTKPATATTLQGIFRNYKIGVWSYHLAGIPLLMMQKHWYQNCFDCCSRLQLHWSIYRICMFLGCYQDKNGHGFQLWCFYIKVVAYRTQTN